MPKQEESKTVNYSKDQMFDLVADIDRYDEFLPWCNNSKIINTSIKAVSYTHLTLPTKA